MTIMRCEYMRVKVKCKCSKTRSFCFVSNPMSEIHNPNPIHNFRQSLLHFRITRFLWDPQFRSPDTHISLSTLFCFQEDLATSTDDARSAKEAGPGVYNPVKFTKGPCCRNVGTVALHKLSREITKAVSRE